MLGKTHFYLGIIIIIIFLITGQYMHYNFEHLKNMELMNRALFRAGHVYILLFGLINVSLGTHFKISEISFVKRVQLFSSAIIFISYIPLYTFGLLAQS